MEIMNMLFGTFIALFLGFIAPVLSTQYCSSVTLNNVAAISCGNNYHCCTGYTKCCRDVGHLTNGAITGIAVSGAIFIAVIMCITLCYVKFRHPRQNPTNKVDAHIESDDNSSTSTEHASYDHTVVDEKHAPSPTPYSETGDEEPYIIKTSRSGLNRVFQET